MPDGEQHENLKDLLGFDPNENSSPSTISKPDNEKFGWPKNWQDLFQQAINEDVDGTFTIVNQDPDQLFSIRHDNLFNTYYREFWRFANNAFTPSTDMNLKTSEIGEIERLNVKTCSDSPRDYVVLTFNSGWEEALAINKSLGHRYVHIVYDQSGEFIRLKLFASSQDGSREKSGRVDFYDHNNLFTPSVNSASFIPEFDLPLKVKRVGQNIEVERLEGGHVIDELSIPFKVNIDEVVRGLVPGQLLKNPSDPNILLDAGWKGKDVFEYTGHRWEIKAQDELGSGTSFPPPADDSEQLPHSD